MRRQTSFKPLPSFVLLATNKSLTTRGQTSHSCHVILSWRQPWHQNVPVWYTWTFTRKKRPTWQIKKNRLTSPPKKQRACKLRSQKTARGCTWTQSALFIFGVDQFSLCMLAGTWLGWGWSESLVGRVWLWEQAGRILYQVPMVTTKIIKSECVWQRYACSINFLANRQCQTQILQAKTTEGCSFQGKISCPGAMWTMHLPLSQVRLASPVQSISLHHMNVWVWLQTLRWSTRRTTTPTKHCLKVSLSTWGRWFHSTCPRRVVFVSEQENNNLFHHKHLLLQLKFLSTCQRLIQKRRPGICRCGVQVMCHFQSTWIHVQGGCFVQKISQTHSRILVTEPVK